MLSKISHISISILLLIATTGLTISNHYCSHSLAQSEKTSTESNCCDVNSDCCHKEVQTLRIDNEFESTKFIVEIASNSMPILRSNNTPQIDFLDNSKVIYPFEGPPPLITLEFLSNIQVYLL